jgi:hypothetical protein
MSGSRAVHGAVLSCLGAFLGACADQESLGFCEPSEQGVSAVIADAPREWTTSPVFTELWRAGGTREDQVLGLPAGLAVARDGRVALPDLVLGEVMVVAADGTWLGTRMPHGPGPGEVGAPVAVTWDTLSNLLAWDVENGRVVTIREGSAEAAELRVNPAFNRSILVAGEVLYAAVQGDGSVLAIQAEIVERRPDGLSLTRESLQRVLGEGDPETLATVTFESLTSGWPRGGATALTAASSHRGSIAYADAAGDYRIHVIRPTGERLLICRDAPALPLTDAELGRDAPAGWENPAAALAAAGPTDSPAAIGRLFFDADERLWVQRERPRPFGDGDRLFGVPGARYDVYSPAGDYLGEITSPPAARLLGALGDTVLAFETGELDTTWVVAYQLRSP